MHKNAEIFLAHFRDQIVVSGLSNNFIVKKFNLIEKKHIKNSHSFINTSQIEHDVTRNLVISHLIVFIVFQQNFLRFSEFYKYNLNENLNDLK